MLFALAEVNSLRNEDFKDATSEVLISHLFPSLWENALFFSIVDNIMKKWHPNQQSKKLNPQMEIQKIIKITN